MMSAGTGQGVKTVKIREKLINTNKKTNAQILNIFSNHCFERNSCFDFILASTITLLISFRKLVIGKNEHSIVFSQLRS